MLREIDKFEKQYYAELKGDIIDAINEKWFTVSSRLENATEERRRKEFELALDNLAENCEIEELEELAEDDIFTFFLF